MDFASLLIWLWLVLFAVTVSGILTGMLAKGEFLFFSLVVDAISTVLAFTFLLRSHHWYSVLIWVVLLANDIRVTKNDYMKWKNHDDDDDDDFKHKRRVKIKNKIPKPTVVQLRPMPNQT